MTATVTPACYIAKSAHQGRWTKVLKPGSFRMDAFSARELATAENIPTLETGEFVLWEFSGTTRGGLAQFHRTRFVAQADGSLAAYAADGHLVIIFPADRVIRVLTN